MNLKSRIYQTNKEMFSLSIDLRDLAKMFIDKKVSINSPKETIACYMLAKAYKTHGVILRLAKSGYSEDADMLARTLFDSALIMSACVNDKTDETVMKYIKFDDSMRTRMFNKLKDNDKFKEYFLEREKNPKKDDDKIEEIEQRTQEWITKYGKDFRRKWHSGQTTGELAESVKLKSYFDTAYDLQSQLVHSLPRVINQYLNEVDDQIRMDVEPKLKGVDLSLVSSFNMLFSIVESFNNLYSLVSDEKFKVLANRLVKIAKLDVEIV